MNQNYIGATTSKKGNTTKTRKPSAKAQQSNMQVKNALKSALLELMKEKTYKSLSVSELCRKAGVSRMGFYRNYSIINDLFYDAAVDLNTKVISEIGSPFRITTDRIWYQKALEIIYNNRDTMSIMYQENFQFEWMKVVNSLVVHDPTFSTEKKHQRLIWCGGFENIVACWIGGGCKESVEEIAEYCDKYLPAYDK